MNDALEENVRLRALVDQLRDEVADAKKWAMQERTRRWSLPAPLTDAERSAIADAADRYAALTPESAATVATLRGLLERTRATDGT